LYIVDKSKEVPKLEISKLEVIDFLSFYQSSLVICREREGGGGVRWREREERERGGEE
jgi:hypothetical protein